jgi:hypothetical protein
MAQEQFRATEFKHGKCAHACVKSRVSKRGAKQHRSGGATFATAACRERPCDTHHGVVHTSGVLRNPCQRCRANGGAARGWSSCNRVEPSTPRRCRAGRAGRCSAGGIRGRGASEPKIEVTKKEARVVVKCRAVSRAERVERAATTTGVCCGVLCKRSDGKDAEYRFCSWVSSKWRQYGVRFGVPPDTR